MRMLRRLLLIAAVIATAWGCGDGGDQAAAPSATLRNLGARTGRLIGSAVPAAVLAADAEYAGTLAREFNYVTPENETKWGLVHPEPDVWNFGPADTIVAFAAAHSMQVKGHTLVWHSQLPAYINGGMTQEELRAALAAHIRTLVGHYRGRVLAWDVVNEPIADSGGGLRQTIFLDGLGPDYIAEAFRLAHEADPAALLFINDYQADGLNKKSDYLYGVVRRLVEDGVPIHGVGLQMHLGWVFGRPPTTVQRNMQRFADLGLRVNISEMDVQIKGLPGDLAARLAFQQQTYHDMVAACVAVPACHAVTFWGFTDKYSWIDAFFGEDDPLLFDTFFMSKPAYFGVAQALRGE